MRKVSVIGIKTMECLLFSDKKNHGMIVNFQFLNFQDWVSKIPGLKEWFYAEFNKFHPIKYEINNSTELFTPWKTIPFNSNLNKKLFYAITNGENLNLCLNLKCKRF